MLPLGGWVAGMLMGSCCGCLTGLGGNQADFGPRLDHKSPPWGQHSPARDPHKWLSTSQITQYQGLLYENPHVTIKPCQALNPATLLVGESGHSHDCKEILEEVYASRPDLRDQPISDPDCVLYTAGTSLVKQRQWLQGHATVTEETTIEASSLVSSTGRTICSNPGPWALKR